MKFVISVVLVPAESRLPNEVPTWIGDNSNRTDGVGKLALSICSCVG